MRKENQLMQEFLKSNGIDCRVKFLWTGSLKGLWRLYNPKLQWNEYLKNQLTGLGFMGFDGQPLNKFSGNGGLFSVLVMGHNEFRK